MVVAHWPKALRGAHAKAAAVRDLGFQTGVGVPRLRLEAGVRKRVSVRETKALWDGDSCEGEDGA